MTNGDSVRKQLFDVRHKSDQCIDTLLLFYAFPLHSRTSETLMRTKLCALPF